MKIAASGGNKPCAFCAFGCSFSLSGLGAYLYPEGIARFDSMRAMVCCARPVAEWARKLSLLA